MEMFKGKNVSILDICPMDVFTATSSIVSFLLHGDVKSDLLAELT